MYIMRHRESKPECCIDHVALPADIKFLAPHICQELDHLNSLHRKAFVKNRRIMELAQAKPLRCLHRFVNRCPCFLRKGIEIIRLDQRVNTRTEQLAYPRVRHLLLFKQKIRKLFPPDRIVNINRLIRKSLFSLYSRLGNVQPPKEIKYVQKWDRTEWGKHIKILRKLAKHKVIKKSPQQRVKKLPLSAMKRYKNLAKPKKSHLIEKSDWLFTSQMRNYTASKRIINLAKPVVRDTFMLHHDLPLKIRPEVLKHKASQRVIELSTPNMHKSKSAPSDLKENPFAISPNALKSKASKRLIELAEPREYENVNIREDPFAISKAALKAKAKPRTIELANPRKV